MPEDNFTVKKKQKTQRGLLTSDFILLRNIFRDTSALCYQTSGHILFFFFSFLMERFNGHKSLCVPVPERIYLKVTPLNLKAPPFIPLSFWLGMSAVMSHCSGLFLFLLPHIWLVELKEKPSAALCFFFFFVISFLNKVTSALWLRSLQVIFCNDEPGGGSRPTAQHRVNMIWIKTRR